MNNKAIYKLFMCFLLGISFKVFAIHQEKYEEIIYETISLINTESIENNKEKIEINFALIKEKVQNDLKIGRVDTNINEYLLIFGLLYDDLVSLQSMLINKDIKDLNHKIHGYLNLNSTKKLSLAVQENRVSQKTKILVQKNSSCFYFLNGNIIEFDNFFTVPAGIPFYFAIECQANLFEVKKIVPTETQREVLVNFSNLKKKLEVPATLPNPFNALNDTDDELENIEELDKSRITYRLGIGIVHNTNKLKELEISNAHLPSGTFLSYSLSASYNKFMLSFQYANVTRIAHQSYAFNNPYLSESSEKKVRFTTSSHYYNLGLGREFTIRQFNENFSIDSLLSLNTIILQNTSPEMTHTGFGFMTHIGPTLRIYEVLFMDFKLGIAKYFGQINEFQIFGDLGIFVLF